MAAVDSENNKAKNWRLNIPKPVRAVIFIATRVLLALLFIMVLLTAFKVGMDSMNVYTMLKDGFSLRAQAVMKPTDTDAEKLTRYFSEHAILTDEALNDEKWNDYAISNYYERLDAGHPIVWPWKDEIKFNVVEQVMDIKGTYSSEYLLANGLTEEDVSEAEVVLPEWKNGEFEVTLIRPKEEDESWKIDSIEYKGPAEDRMMKVYEDEEEQEIPDNVVISPEGGNRKTGGGTLTEQTEEDEG